jgi:hypothetical protein
MNASHLVSYRHLGGVTYVHIRPVSPSGKALRFAIQSSYITGTSRKGKAALASNQITLTKASR